MITKGSQSALAQTFAVGGMLVLAACGGSPPPPVLVSPVATAVTGTLEQYSSTVNKADNVTGKGCAIYNSALFMVNVGRAMYVDGKLTPRQKAILDAAEGALSAGCDPVNTTTTARIEAAARGLLDIVYKR